MFLEAARDGQVLSRRFWKYNPSWHIYGPVASPDVTEYQKRLAI
jgi:hypothetical protein